MHSYLQVYESICQFLANVSPNKLKKKKEIGHVT